MKNTESKNYSIFLRSTNQWIPVTEKQFHEYYRDIDSFRKKQQRHGKCVCPKSERYLCDMDCATCSHQTTGYVLSFDCTYETDDGTTYNLADLIADKDPLPADKLEMERLFSTLFEEMPEAVIIGKYRLEGKSDEWIARKIGINRKTFLYRLKRVKAILKKEFPDFF